MSGEPSVFAAHSGPLFVDTDNWVRVKAILEARKGGNYGVSGPRGAGKSWLMLQACDRANAGGGLGVWFPSPSEYQSQAFLSALSEVTAQRYIDYYVAANQYGTESNAKSSKRNRVLFVYVGAVCALVLFVIAFSRFYVKNGLGPSYDGLGAILVDPFLWAAFIVYFGTMFVYFFWRPRRQSFDEVLFRRAIEIRTQARYTSAMKETGEASLGAAFQGMNGLLKRTNESNLAERPSTVSSLIHDYRNFVRRISLQMNGPVVIAIDELDKMHSADAVAQLLRDVKGIFDVEGVHYFASISDEAARSVVLGALRTRNEFNSSFYQIFASAPMDKNGCASLFTKRKILLPDDQVDAVCVLSGGVPREVVRLADTLQLVKDHVRSPALRIVASECEELLHEMERLADERIITESDLSRGSEVLLRLVFDSPQAGQGGGVRANLWSPDWASSSWQEHVHGQWRRFLLRYDVACVVGEYDDEGKAALQAVVRRGQVSAVAGRRLLDELGGALPLVETVDAQSRRPLRVPPTLRSRPRVRVVSSTRIAGGRNRRAGRY